tara:strand:+ start:42039 stop:42809 length:771 start_codon:yes stop_codon:yes gene_type:complete
MMTKKIILLILVLLYLQTNHVSSNEVENHLVAEIDDPTIQIGSNFFGGELLVFGAISGTDLSYSDIIIRVIGKKEIASVRAKNRRYGIWINDRETLVSNIPNFYSVYSNRNINRIADSDLLIENEIGIKNIKLLTYKKDENIEDIFDIVRDKNRENKLYAENFTGVRIIKDKLFRAAIELPMGIKEGQYEVAIFFFRDKELIDSDISNVFVSKTLAGKYIYTQANERPLMYGIIAVFIAWFAGLLIAGITGITRTT